MTDEEIESPHIQELLATVEQQLNNLEKACYPLRLSQPLEMQHQIVGADLFKWKANAIPAQPARALTLDASETRSCMGQGLYDIKAFITPWMPAGQRLRISFAQISRVPLRDGLIITA